MEAHGWLLTTLKSGSLFSREILLNYFYAVIKCLLQEREEQEGNLELNQHAQHPNRHDPYFTTTTEQGQAHGTHRRGCSQGLYCWRHSGAARQQTRISSFLISSLHTLHKASPSQRKMKSNDKRKESPKGWNHKVLVCRENAGDSWSSRAGLTVKMVAAEECGFKTSYRHLLCSSDPWQNQWAH